MCISNATIRRRLRKYANLFISRNCDYNDGYESRAALELLRGVQPVNPEYEKFNKKHPNHGKKRVE